MTRTRYCALMIPTPTASTKRPRENSYVSSPGSRAERPSSKILATTCWYIYNA